MELLYGIAAVIAVAVAHATYAVDLNQLATDSDSSWCLAGVQDDASRVCEKFVHRMRKETYSKCVVFFTAVAEKIQVDGCKEHISELCPPTPKDSSNITRVSELESYLVDLCITKPEEFCPEMFELGKGYCKAVLAYFCEVIPHEIVREGCKDLFAVQDYVCRHL